MHSSRMCTICSSGHISGEGYLVPGGCTWSWGVYLVPGDVPGPGGSAPRGVSAPGGRGVCSSGGCTWLGTPSCGQTDACKNIMDGNKIHKANHSVFCLSRTYREGNSLRVTNFYPFFLRSVCHAQRIKKPNQEKRSASASAKEFIGR